jgi:hypothetical protein
MEGTAMAIGALFLAGIALGGVFIAAGVGKLLQRDVPAGASIERLLLPEQLATLQQRVLPYIELATGSLLVAAPLSRESVAVREAPFALSALLLTAFTAAVALVLARGEDAECHCFGRSGAGRVTIHTLGRNLALLALAAAGCACSRLAPPRPVWDLPSSAILPLLLIGTGGAGLAVLASEAWSPKTEGRRYGELDGVR